MLICSCSVAARAVLADVSDTKVNWASRGEECKPSAHKVAERIL